MALTLTATFDTALAAVTLTVSGNVTAIDPGYLAGIYRSDANGMHSVRTVRDGLDHNFSAGSLTVTDYEPALAGPVQYIAYGYNSAATLPAEASAWVEYPTSADKRPCFMVPVLPTNAARVEQVNAYGAEWANQSTVHHVIDREFPVITRSRRRGRQGRLKVLCNTYEEASSLGNFLTEAHNLFLRQADHAGMDMYFTALSASANPEGGLWTLDVQYQETGYEDHYILDGWTFQDLATNGSDFLNVAFDYPTFSDLTANRKGYQ